MDFNYATVELEKTADNDIKLDLAIKNIFNSDVKKKTIFVNKELKFNKDLVKYDSMCSAIHSYHRKML